MGQKVHPTGIRLGIVKDWNSRWYASSKDYSVFLYQDLKVREFLRKKLAHASVSRIQINRPANNAQITIFTARPGIVIGKKGEDIEVLKQEIAKMIGVPVQLNVEEIRKPELDAYLVAEGVKINVGGRLNGAEIARSEWYREGRVPLHTLRADIDYATAEAHTTYGIIGIKVWIFKGEVFDIDAHKASVNSESKK